MQILERGLTTFGFYYINHTISSIKLSKILSVLKQRIACIQYLPLIIPDRQNNGIHNSKNIWAIFTASFNSNLLRLYKRQKTASPFIRNSTNLQTIKTPKTNQSNKQETHKFKTEKKKREQKHANLSRFFGGKPHYF